MSLFRIPALSVREFALAAAFACLLSHIPDGYCDQPPAAELATLEVVPPADWTSEQLIQALQGLPSDRKTENTYRLFRASVETGDVEAALRELNRLQTASPTTLVIKSDTPGTFIPLYRAVCDAVFLLPEPVRRRLGEQNDLARSRLLDILTNRTPDQLPQFLLTYAGTSAAIEAHLLIGRLMMDRGHHLAAAAWLQPLLHASVPPSVRQTAQIAFDSCTDSAETNARSALGAADTEGQIEAVPRHLIWHYRPLISPRVREQMRTLQQSAAASKVPLQSTWTDAVDDAIAYRRSLRGLSAIDINTGQAKWDYPLSPSIDDMVRADGQSRSAFQRIDQAGAHPQSFDSLDNTVITDTFCRNQNLGTVTGDNDLLYALSSGTSLPARNRSSFPRAIRPSSSNTNDPGMRLVAVEKSTGRRVWTFGRDAMQQVMKVNSTGFWISGPPTVSGKSLYCVMEWNGEIMLVSLQQNTGECQWKCVLTFPEQSVDKDTRRQTFRCRPIVDQGLIWCRTSTTCVTCVDAATGHLIWACRESPVAAPTVPTINRGRPVLITQGKPMVQRWAREEAIRAGRKLLLTSLDRHQISVLDSITGRLDRTFTFPERSIILNADESQVIIGQPGKLTCLNTGSQSIRWTTPLELKLPVGRAAVCGQHVVVATASGGLLKIRLADGKIVSEQDAVLPNGVWGELIAAPDESGDLLYSAPDSLLRLSKNPSHRNLSAPFDLADGFLAAGKWQQALDIIAEIGPENPRYSDAADLRFQCLLQLARRSPADWLDMLKDAAKSANRQIFVQLLEAQLQLDEGLVEDAQDSLLQLLSVPDQLATLPVLQEFDRDRSASEQPVDRTVRTWAALRLSELIESEHSTELSSARLNDLPAASLLALRTATARPALLRMALEAEREVAIHLFRHAVDLATQKDETPNDLSAEADAWITLRNRLTNSNDSGPTAALMKICESEFGPEFQAALASREDTGDSSTADSTRSRLQAACDQWEPGEFRAIPISRNTMSYGRNHVSLAISHLDDPFLSQYEWTILRDEYGRLLARAIGYNDDQWTVAGTFQVTGSYSARADFIYRTGSVLLIRSMSSLAAVSVAERRVIWRHDARSRQAIASWSRDADGFDRLVPGKHLLPSDSSYRGMGTLQIAGLGFRWLCVRINDEVRMLDTLTGELTWTAKNIANTTHVTASDTAVVLKHADGRVDVLNRTSGERIDAYSPSDKSAATLRSVFTGSGSDVVSFTARSEESPALLQWLNPLTGETTKRLHFPNATWFQFLDDRTMVSFGDQQDVTITDLITGNRQQLSYGDGSDDDADERFADTKRLQIDVDSANYYVTVAPEAGAVPFRAPSGRMLTRFQSPILAISRDTGKLRWSFEKDAILLATTDQPGLPVLLVIEVANTQQIPGTMSGTMSDFTALHKLTGKPLFSKKLPAQSGLRYLQIQSPSPNVLDLGLPGNLIRIARVTPTEDSTNQDSTDSVDVE